MTLQQLERQTVYGMAVGAKVVVATEADPTARLLGKYAHLVFAYQYGLAAVEVDGLEKGLDLVAGPGVVGGACIIQSQVVESQDLLELGPAADRPLFLLVPRARLDEQQRFCAGLDHVYLCPWEGALQASEGAFTHTVGVAFKQRGAEDLLRLVEAPEGWALIESRLQHIDTLPTLPETDFTDHAFA